MEEKMQALEGQVYGLSVLLAFMIQGLAKAANDGGTEGLLKGLEEPVSHLPTDLRLRIVGTPFFSGFEQAFTDVRNIIKDKPGFSS